jgi:hypothetical protein
MKGPMNFSVMNMMSFEFSNASTETRSHAIHQKGGRSHTEQIFGHLMDLSDHFLLKAIRELADHILRSLRDLHKIKQ